MHRVALAALLVATLACSLVSEATISSEDRLVSDQRPALLVIAPANQSTYAAGSPVIFHAIAKDSIGVSRVEFIINLAGGDEKLVYETDDPDGEPYVEAIVEWEATGNQVYLASARAYRPSGLPEDPADDIGSNEVLFSFGVVPPPTIDEPDIALTPEVTDETPTPLPDLPAIDGVIQGAAEVPVRQGPSTDYPIIQTLAVASPVQIVGRSLDSVWLVIQLDGAYGWVFRDAVQFEGTLDDLTPVEAPPINP